MFIKFITFLEKAIWHKDINKIIFILVSFIDIIYNYTYIKNRRSAEMILNQKIKEINEKGYQFPMILRDVLLKM